MTGTTVLGRYVLDLKCNDPKQWYQLNYTDSLRCVIVYTKGSLQKKKNYGDSEIGPTPLNPPTPTSAREKTCRDSCVEI